MTKKLWLTAGFLPFVVAPVAIVASCSNDLNNIEAGQIPTIPSESQADADKAVANIKMLFYGHISTFHLFKASQFGPTQINNSKSPFPKAYLPKLDPRQNFGFQSEYQTIEDNDDLGLKKLKVTLTRGTEVKEEILEIKGFLTNAAAQNETENHLDPEKVFKGFDRTNPTSFNKLLTATVSGTPDIKTYLAKDAQTIVDEIKSQILKAPAQPGTPNQQAATSPEVEIKALVAKPIQWSTFGVKENVLRLDVQIVEKSTSLADPATPKKSGVYSLMINGFAQNEELFNEANFNAAAYGVNTLNSPVRPATGKDYYATKRASEITTDELLKAEIDPNLSSILKISDIQLVPNSANDQEGSLRVTAQLGFANKISKTMNFKLYGFKIVSTPTEN